MEVEKTVDIKPCLLISACLLGEGCRYDGRSMVAVLPSHTLAALRKRFVLVPICPEVMGGLPVPRMPAERAGDRVIREDGTDVTDAYRRGAAAALVMARNYGTVGALLKAKSPSCGKGAVYDGTFTHTLCDGNGVCADALIKEGIPVFSEQDVDALLASDGT